jgi:hypothetical protein
VGARTYPVTLPAPRDPRLHIAAVLVAVQVLGQIALDFDLSIAQILTSLVTCATIEVVVRFRREGAIAWPASALLTGNGVALILRVPGTEHGDWWSLDGWYYFAGVAAFSLATKYLIRHRGGHVFNPSNIGLVAAFLILGPERIEPLDFWWGPMSPGLAVATLVIVVGGLAITARLGMLGMAFGFWATFATSIAVVALAGHCMSATWRFGPICGASFWWVLVTSPEVLIFLFFMITDPKTTPEGRVARVLFGTGVGFASALLAAAQDTEYATKVAVLGGLAVMSVARYALVARLPAAGASDDSLRAWVRSRPTGRRSLGTVPLLALIGTGCVVALVAANSITVEPAGVDRVVAARADTIDQSALPAVVVSDDTGRLTDRVDEATAAVIATDVVTALESEHQVVSTGDRALAAEAFTMVRLDDILYLIEQSEDGVAVTVSDYSIETITVVPVYDTKNAQSGWQLGADVRGTVRFATVGSAGVGGWSEPEPFGRVYALHLEGDRYLVAADYPIE